MNSRVQGPVTSTFQYLPLDFQRVGVLNCFVIPLPQNSLLPKIKGCFLAKGIDLEKAAVEKRFFCMTSIRSWDTIEICEAFCPEKNEISKTLG